MYHQREDFYGVPSASSANVMIMVSKMNTLSILMFWMIILKFE